MYSHKATFTALLLVAFITLWFSSSAQVFVAGGEMSYKFLYGTGGENPRNFYEVTLKIYKECLEETNLPPSVEFRIAMKNPVPINPPYNRSRILGSADMSEFYVTKQTQSECFNYQMPTCYFVGVYRTTISVEPTSGDWLVYCQDNQRKSGSFVNVSTSGIGKPSGGVMGFTYTCLIPGYKYSSASPTFKKEYPLILCAGQKFRYDFSAADPDGDSLVYQFAPALQGMIYTTPRFPGDAHEPPFYPLKYYTAFTSATPFGDAVTIDPRTGSINGTAPNIPGRYIAVIEVLKYRNGSFVISHKKEMQFLFQNCTSGAQAQLDSTYRNCKGKTIKFLNYSSGQIQSYSWDFGDPATSSDTSNLAEPTYTYPAPGTYTVRLWLNKGTNKCKDSTIATVIVDTGLNAAFNVRRSLAVCNQALYDFTNSSTEGANPISSYEWDFGESTDPADKASTTDAQYLYPTEGSKLVRMIIKNDIGCSDTAFRSINVFKSVMKAPPDTTICNLDTISLNTNTNGYPGAFSWTPNYNISSLTVGSPLVSPKKDTTYFVRFVDTTGCATLDSVRVKVRDTVKIQINNIDTTICRFDTLYVSSIHDGNTVTWQPNSNIFPLHPDGSSLWTFPRSNVQMIATVHFGSCVASDTFNLKVVPKPQVSISADTMICVGAPVYLSASGGSIYSWSPAGSLDDANIPNPVAQPKITTVYKVRVTDTLGCPKPVTATVRVSTYRALYAIAEKDTMVVMGEPVQLLGSGGIHYRWTPSLYLSDATIPNPVARPYEDMIYTLKISNDDHCEDSAIVHIRAFVDPDIYVPSAFTPNNDGLNDLFRVTAVGFILEDLKIFDRWGNLVFTSRNEKQGWDGKLKGQPLASGTFVWMAKGKNKKTGAMVTKKGQVTLIR